jgi:hypothetical protein
LTEIITSAALEAMSKPDGNGQVHVKRSGPKGLGHIERGETKPRPASLEAIAKALGVTVEDLLVDEQEEEE